MNSRRLRRRPCIWDLIQFLQREEERVSFTKHQWSTGTSKKKNYGAIATQSRIKILCNWYNENLITESKSSCRFIFHRSKKGPNEILLLAIVFLNIFIHCTSNIPSLATKSGDSTKFEINDSPIIYRLASFVIFITRSYYTSTFLPFYILPSRRKLEIPIPALVL